MKKTKKADDEICNHEVRMRRKRYLDSWRKRYLDSLDKSSMMMMWWNNSKMIECTCELIKSNNSNEDDTQS